MLKLLSFLVVSSFGLSSANVNAASKLQVLPNPTVSIPPLVKISDALLGEKVTVSLLPGGHNPVTYDPTMAQLTRLSKSDVFFSLGLPFEKTLISKIKKLNAGIVVVDLRKGLGLQPIEVEIHKDEKNHHHHHHHHDGLDPHIWLDPIMLDKIAVHMASIFESILEKKSNKNLNHLLMKLERNTMKLRLELSSVYQGLESRLKPFRGNAFMVFHPAYGHFADRFGLEQMAIEQDGKEPGPKALARILKDATAKGIKRIYVQKAFSSRGANWLAKTMGVPKSTIDPLAPDPIASINELGSLLAKDFQTVYSAKK